MAWAFDGSTVRNVSAGTVPTIGYPYSLFVRARHADVTSEGYPFGVKFQGAADAVLQLGFRGDAAGDPVELRRGNPGSTTVARSAGAYSASVWTSIGAYSESSTVFGIYRDGVHSPGTGTTAYPSVVDPNIVMGGFAADNSAKLNGAAFTASIWPTVLTAGEFLALHAGCPPWRVRPQSQLFYMPCVVPSQLTDRKAGITLGSGPGTLGFADSPRVYGRP